MKLNSIGPFGGVHTIETHISEEAKKLREQKESTAPVEADSSVDLNEAHKGIVRLADYLKKKRDEKREGKGSGKGSKQRLAMEAYGRLEQLDRDAEEVGLHLNKKI